MELYAHWLQRAHFDRGARQEYFRGLIENKAISHANFRLAHLLTEKSLATLVVTPNFDDFLTRALDLFGQPHIVCDHPATTERINPESSDIQIVHVHGTYWFYDLCNLPGEIKARTKRPPSRSPAMSILLDRILDRHSPIVIGYSGWEGDVIMKALKRRLRSELHKNLYWFCYHRSDADDIPQYVKDSLDVCLVLPSLPPSRAEIRPASESNPGAASAAPGPRIASRPVGPEAKLASGPTDADRPLTAQSVLDDLVGALTKQTPALTQYPIGFFASQLAKSFPPDSSEKTSEDIYTLRRVLRQVEEAKADEERKIKRRSIVEADVERIHDLNRRAAYAEALLTAGKLKLQALGKEQREALIAPLASAAFGIRSNSQASDDDAQLAINGCDMVLRLAGASKAALNISVQQDVARALLVKSFLLHRLNRKPQALRACDQLVRRFGDAPDPLLRERVATALRNRVIVLWDLTRGEEAVQAADQLVERFGEAPEPALREQVAVAMANKGFYLGQLNRGEEAVRVFDDVLRRFSDLKEPTSQKIVANTLVNKGVALAQLKRSQDAIQAYDDVVIRFSDVSEPAVRESVALALVNKAFTLRELDKNEDSLQTVEELLRRFGNATEPPLLEQVAAALYQKGLTLGRLKRNLEEIQAYDELTSRFDKARDLAVREMVGNGLLAKAVSLAELTRPEDAILAYDEIVSRFGEATELTLREQVADALLYKSFLLVTLKRREEAKVPLEDLLKRFASLSDATLQRRVQVAKNRLKAMGDAAP